MIGFAEAGMVPQKPFPAYRGLGAFVFVCYAHSDSKAVYAELVALNEAGINFWYDEGIRAGRSWRAEIAAAIQGASKLLFFISSASLQSNHCLREVDYALSRDIEIVPVYLDDSRLPPELELALNRVQALFKQTDSRYMEHLLEVLRSTDTPVSIPLTRRRNFRAISASAAVAVLLLLAGVYWAQTDSPVDDGRTADASTGLPTAFNLYLEGTDLIEEWALNGNLDRSIEILGQAVELDSGFALGYARLAEALRIKYAATGERSFLDEAVANSNQALRLGPGLAPVQIISGRIQAAQGNYDLAFATLERGLAIDPNDALANQAMASLYSNIGRIEDAEDSFRRAIALEPDNLFIVDAYGNFLYRQERYEEAIEQWRSVLRQAPGHYGALVNMGSALDALGRISEAIAMYARANEVQGTYMGYSNLGVAYAGMGRYQEAIDAFYRAIEIFDEDRLAWGNLAYAYAWMGGAEADSVEAFKKAIEVAEATLQQRPRDPFVYIDLALYYAQIGERELALQRMETATVLAPELSDVYASAAEIYEVFGQRDQAVEHLRRALELDYPRQLLLRNPELEELLGDPELAAIL